MKNMLFVIMVSLLLWTGAHAQASGVQLGVILIGPTGISGKVWLDGRSALDGAVTGSLAEQGSSLYLHADYLRHIFGKMEVQGGQLPLYFGVGGKLGVADGADPSFGVRIPLGVSYIYGENLFDMFFEMVPFVDFAPRGLFSLAGAVGFRLFL